MKKAAFLAIYSNSVSFAKYFRGDITEGDCPCVIMIDRWDGKNGFPGGGANKNETILQALQRETYEELGINIDTNDVILTNVNVTKIKTYFYTLELSEENFMKVYFHILNNFSKSILSHAKNNITNTRFLTEITGIKIVPIINYKNKGIDIFMQNQFSGCAKDDLQKLIEKLNNIKI